MAGDVLKVEILEITLDQQGVMCALPDNGVLGSLVKEESVNKKKRNPILQKQLKRKRICGLAVS
jgi:acetamidase/formamidase